MERTVKLTLRPKKPAASQMIGKLYAEQTKLATQLYNKTIEAKRLQSELESEKRANADLEKIVSDQLSELNRERDMNAFLRLNNSGNVKEKEQLSNELKIMKLAMQDLEARLEEVNAENEGYRRVIEVENLRKDFQSLRQRLVRGESMSQAEMQRYELLPAKIEQIRKGHSEFVQPNTQREQMLQNLLNMREKILEEIRNSINRAM